MGSFETPKTWVPNMNTKDCSQGFCSLYCPQWCYVIFPPPPPFEFPDENSGPSFSPLVIAIIGILASAFMLVSYYAIISKLCGNMDSPRRRETHDPNLELEETQDPSNHEPWHVSSNGLDEALIKSITVCKYTKGDGLIECTDCSVCLSEFQESETLRLLPKCSHAFHVKCIDTWLRSHSNCPLCRANIVQVTTSPIQLPPPVSETPINNEIYSQASGEAVITEADNRDLRNFADGDCIVEIREVEYQQVRRSVSMSNLSQARISIADVICIDQDEEDYEFPNDDVGSSKKANAEISKRSHKNRVLECVTSPIGMKRSFSSGRFLFPKCGREQNTVIPF